ncbi:MAG: MOSC domain-containing protein, partial [Bryobacteraceae bacterium]
RYRAGVALLELTTPRAPCHNLDVYDPALGRELYDKQVRSGDPSTSRWALGGFYAAVIEPGLVRPGDPISLVSEVA